MGGLTKKKLGQSPLPNLDESFLIVMILTLSGSAIYVSYTKFIKIGFSTKAIPLDFIFKSICILDPNVFFVINTLLFAVAVPSVYTVSNRKA